jgi:PUA domain protein
LRKETLSRRDSQEKITEIEQSLSVKLNLSKSSQIELVEPKDSIQFLSIGDYVFISTKDGMIPFLGSQPTLQLFPSATVDQGAIKYVLNGADVMRPGVRSFDAFSNVGSMMTVKEETKGRTIAVGRAMVSGEEMAVMAKGPCINNLHFIGDKFWQLYKMI